VRVPLVVARGVARLKLIARAATVPLGPGGWRWPSNSPREPFVGAWQRNLTCAPSPDLLAFSAVYACVNVITSDMGKLPLQVLVENPDGERVVFKRHPAHILLRKPNHYQVPLQFIQQWMTSKLLSGNTYALKRRDNRGVVNAMYILDPGRVTPLVSEDGSVFYRLAPNNLSQLPQNVVVPASEIIHDRCVTLFHPLCGVTPIYAAAASASAGANILAQTDKFFANMSRPSGVITSPQRITEATATRLQKEWEDNFALGNIGRVAVLGEDLKWQTMGMSAVDAQLIEQLKWSVEDVARVFRVPPFMLGDLSNASYRNNEQMFRTYYNGCLAHHIESMEQLLDDGLVLGEDVYVEFDLEALFRMEFDIRINTMDKAIKAGIYTINEARRKEGLKKQTGGDEPLVQMQYVPLSIAVDTAKANLDKAKNPPAPPPVALPPPNEPPTDEEPPEETEEDEEEQRALLVEGVSTLLLERLAARRARQQETRQAAS
jgi:HK97 family phage portal protein